jgi:hypothetical protein
MVHPSAREQRFTDQFFGGTEERNEFRFGGLFSSKTFLNLKIKV